MATYVIGDIQGCFEPLMRLLEAVRFDPLKDHLWLAGDLVNRGPDSLKVLRWAKEHQDQITAVLGNHDLHLLARFYGAVTAKRSDTLDQLLSAEDAQALMDWLRHRPLAHYDSRANAFMAHAGLLPAWGATEAVQYAAEVEHRLRGPNPEVFLNEMYGNQPDRWQPELQGFDRLRVIVNSLTRMRFINADGCLDFQAKEGLDSAPDGFMPWFEAENPKQGQTRVFFGHWAALQGTTGKSLCIATDTGCVWNGALTAVALDTLERTSVPAFP